MTDHCSCPGCEPGDDCPLNELEKERDAAIARADQAEKERDLVRDMLIEAERQIEELKCEIYMLEQGVKNFELSLEREK